MSVCGGEARRGLALSIEGAGGRVVSARADIWVAPSADGRRVWVLLDVAQRADAGDDPLRRLGEAAACVSHQIKNSLHALRGFAGGIEGELAPESGGPPSTRQLLRALDSLGELTEDVLAMSGAPRSANERIPLHEVISSAVVLARHAADRVRVVLPPDEIHVFAHRGQLVHALFNLIDNACRVTPPDRTVTVLVREEGGRAFVEILDGGPGFPAGLEITHGRAPSANGSGYGVLAARRFLEACGGELAFERASGGGTRCLVSLAAGGARAEGI